MFSSVAIFTFSHIHRFEWWWHRWYGGGWCSFVANVFASLDIFFTSLKTQRFTHFYLVQLWLNGYAPTSQQMLFNGHLWLFIQFEWHPHAFNERMTDTMTLCWHWRILFVLRCFAWLAVFPWVFFRWRQFNYAVFVSEIVKNFWWEFKLRMLFWKYF